MIMITMSSHSCGEGNDKLQGQHLSHSFGLVSVIEREYKGRKLTRQYEEGIVQYIPSELVFQESKIGKVSVI